MNNLKLSDAIPIDTVSTDGMSASYNTRSSDGVRIIIVATGGASATVQAVGSHDDVNYYPLGAPIVFAADSTQTYWIEEPNTVLAVQVSGYASGDFDIFMQEYK